jgi:4-amino-4-deoxy-L-arabinose transferase-like glycosyltransferase
VPSWGWCLVFFAVALDFNLYRLGSPSIWFDEAFSVELARQPLPLLWHIIWGPEPNMELYYLFLHYWLAFTAFLGLHPVEWVVRLPSAIFAALSTVMVFLLGRRFLGLLCGLLAASLYLLNDLQLVYAQQTRSYSMQLFLLCLACYALFSALTVDSPPRQKRWWIGFVVVAALSVYAHLFSLLVLLALLCAVGVLLLLPNAWRTAVRQRLPALLFSLLCIFVLIIPMLLVSLHGAKTGWLPVPHLGDIYHLFVTMSGDSKLFFLINAACCVVALGLLLLAYVQPKSGILGLVAHGGEAAVDAPGVNDGSASDILTLRQAIPVAFALLCWLVVPVVVSFIVSHGSTRLFSSRYLVVVVPPFCLLVALGVALLRWRMVQVVIIVVLLLVALSVVPHYYASAQVEDWNVTTFWLEQHYQPGDGLICYDNAVEQGCQISVQYYLDAYPTAAHFTADAPGAFSWQQFGPASPASGPDAATNPTALSAFGAHHSRLFFIVGRLPDAAAAARAKAAQHWLDTHYHFVAQIITRTVTIRLYATQ